MVDDGGAGEMAMPWTAAVAAAVWAMAMPWTAAAVWAWRVAIPWTAERRSVVAPPPPLIDVAIGVMSTAAPNENIRRPLFMVRKP